MTHPSDMAVLVERLRNAHDVYDSLRIYVAQGSLADLECDQSQEAIKAAIDALSTDQRTGQEVAENTLALLREQHDAMADVMMLRRPSDNQRQRGTAEAAIAVWRRVHAYLAANQQPLEQMVALDEELDAEYPGWMTGEAAALTKAAPPVEADLRRILFDELRRAWFAGRGSGRREQYDSEAVEAAWEKQIATILAALQQSQSTPGAALLEAARDVVRDYPVAAGTAKGFSHEPGYGSIKRLAAALAVSPVPVDASGALRAALTKAIARLNYLGDDDRELLIEADKALHAAPAPVAGPGHAERICRTAAAWEMEQAARPGIGKKSADCHRSAAMALEMAADDIAKLKTHPASENRHDG